MIKKIFSIKTLLALLSVVCLGVGFGNIDRAEVSADESNNIAAKVERVEALNDGAQFMFHFQYADGYTTDYMTTEWEAGDNTTYHWYLKDESFGMPEEDFAKFDSLGGQLAYEDKDKYNMPNALLDKNLDAYNFGEYILIDGVPLSNYEYVLYANRFTYVHTLSIELVGDLSPIVNATNLEIKAGCTLPTITYSYFGEGEPSALVIEEEQLFKAKNGSWVRSYRFDGYEAGKTYDASEEFFYVRQHGSTYKGHPEAVAYEYTDVFAVNGWGDDGYAVATTPETYKGNVCVFELVQPIDASQFGLIDVYLFSNCSRTLASHNAYNVTEESLGKTVDKFSIAPRVFSKVTLVSALYANDEGMIDQFVFEFTNDGDADETQNQFFLGSFTVRTKSSNLVLNDQFLSWDETDTQYNFTLRFNKQGEFNDALQIDTSKVLINGVSVKEINAKGQYATAQWETIAGVYQIGITLDKSYTGAGQFFNADLGYTGNKLTVKEGIVFPNGDVLDCAYTCNIYPGELLVDREFIKEYKETAVTGATFTMCGERDAYNLQLRVTFDKELCSQEYVHACDKEAWRAGALEEIGYYDKAMSDVFVVGGFKSSLLDSILINGKTLGELHAEDEYTTCVFVHCGQIGQKEALNIFVDSNSATYQWLKPLFEEGNGVTLEIKSGFKFPNGVMTAEDCKYVWKDGAMVRETNETVSIFYDGKAVADGDALKINAEALESSVAVIGTSEYKVTKTLKGNVATFVVEYKGEKITFTVEQNVVDLDPIDKQVVTEEPSANGCASVVSGGLIGSMALIALGATALIRRKRDEENQ